VAAPPSRRLHRHPSDVARLVFNLALLAGFVLLDWLAPSGLRAFAADLINLVGALPRPAVQAMVGVVQLLAITVPVVGVGVLLWRRRFVLLGILALAAALSAVLMALMSEWFVEAVPLDELGVERFESWLIGGEFPSSTYLCAATAVLVAAAPWLSRRWRRAGWIFLAATLLARVLTSTEVPIRIAVLVTLGGACGSLALVIVGAPRRRVDEGTIAAALDRAGLAPRDVSPRQDDDGVPTFSAAGGDGGYLVKVLGRDERDSDLLIYTWRRLTLRGLGDGAPAGAPEHVVDHEALALGLFASAGVAAPSPVATIGTPDGAALLVTSAVDGRRLSAVPADEIGDDLLASLWRQVAALQRRRLAHGRLNAAHVVVGDAGPILVDLRWADLDSNDEALGVDVAELLASLTVLVGPERAVAAAARELPAEHLARAVPLVQPAALTPATRRALADDKAVTADLRTRLAAAAGVEDVELAPVQRITVKGAVSLVGSAVLGWYLLSLAANWQDIWEAFGEANLAYAVPVVLLTAGTYLAGAVSLLGAVTTHLALLRTTAVMVGQAFLNRFTPANAGGMAMRVRYLQLNGLETPTAVTAIGLTSAASGVAQVLFIVVFFIWGGTSDRFSDFTFPSVGTILVVVLVIGLVASVVLYSSWGRNSIRPWLHGVTLKVRDTVTELARDPGKMAMLLGGACLGKLCNVTCFWLSVLAFDVGMSFPKAGALYMVASTVGSAVPTPGGVGGVEAALTAVLIGFGVDSATAAAIVLFFRTITYWLPTIPGYGFLQYTQRRGIV
jgi:undecaprenyl-diphosphatase